MTTFRGVFETSVIEGLALSSLHKNSTSFMNNLISGMKHFVEYNNLSGMPFYSVINNKEDSSLQGYLLRLANIDIEQIINGPNREKYKESNIDNINHMINGALFSEYKLLIEDLNSNYSCSVSEYIVSIQDLMFEVEKITSHDIGIFDEQYLSAGGYNPLDISFPIILEYALSNYIEDRSAKVHLKNRGCFSLNFMENDNETYSNVIEYRNSSDELLMHVEKDGLSDTSGVSDYIMTEGVFLMTQELKEALEMKNISVENEL